MPSFGTKSLRHLGTCHVDAQLIMAEVIKEFDCSILEGHRPKELQAHYFETGASKVKVSLHNSMPAMAWHAMPWFQSNPQVDWHHLPSMFHLAGYIRGVALRLRVEGRISHTVRWGGDWNRNFDVREKQWNDLAHYELR